MTYKVQLIYFRQTGKFLARAEMTIVLDELVEVWEAVDDMRRLGRLPGLRPGAGRDLFIVVDVPDHPKRMLHMVMPPFVDDDDVTPSRVSTSEMMPLVRVPLDELPRTSTRDVLKVDPTVIASAQDGDTIIAADEEITPVDQPIPKPAET